MSSYLNFLDVCLDELERELVERDVIENRSINIKLVSIGIIKC